MTIRAGDLRHLVRIEKHIPGRETDGSVAPEWELVATSVPAEIKPLKGRELYTAQQNQAEVVVRIIMRYRPGLASQMRVVYRKTIYSIAYIVNVEEMNRELHLMCTAGVNEG